MISVAEKRGINQEKQERYFLGRYELGQMLEEDALRSGTSNILPFHLEHSEAEPLKLTSAY